jgi:hypothetical protein
VPESERMLTSRRIPASASDVFCFITDPREQVRIDGSGMLVAAPDAQRLVAVGDSFEMDMDREPLGDVPLGKYRVVNTVTKIIVDKQLEWNVAWPGSPPFGHVYGYLLEVVGSGETHVSSYCDWSAISDEWRGHIHFPVVPKWMLEMSLEKLEGVLKTRARSRNLERPGLETLPDP